MPPFVWVILLISDSLLKMYRKQGVHLDQTAENFQIFPAFIQVFLQKMLYSQGEAGGAWTSRTR